MTLTLEPAAECPYVNLLEGLSAKIKDANLSFVKELQAQATAHGHTYSLHVFDQTVEADQVHAYDPPLSLCPAVTLLTSGFPPVRDRGIGSEIWHFEVAVLFKMELPEKDSREGLRAFWELTRTIMAGNKTPQIDPIAIAAAGALADYRIADEMNPPTSSERDGFRVARGMFIVQFRVADNLRG